MKLTEVLACCAMLLVFSASCASLLLSYKTVSDKTEVMRCEVEHDSFIVGGFNRAVDEHRIEDFFSVCKSLWPDEEIFLTQEECRWTHAGKHKAMKIQKEQWRSIYEYSENNPTR